MKGVFMERTQLRPIFDDYCGTTRVRTMTLMITHACNLNCTYCYEEYKCEAYMTAEDAIRFVQQEIGFVASSDQYDALQIDFMGGEPLMNFPVMKAVVEYLEANPPSIQYICFATTNGTLLNDERKKWFRKYRDVMWLGCSCDGTEQMQQANRGTNQKQIDYDFFLETWPIQSLHMTISRESLPTLADGILYLQRKGFRMEAALAQGIEWTKEDAELYRNQLKKLAGEYIADPTIPPINLLGHPLSIELSKDDAPIAPQQKFCGTGTHMVTYDIDGRRYGCHLFTPVVLGDTRGEIGNFDWANADVYNDERCNRCVLRQMCPTCAGFNFKYRGAIGKRDMRACLMALARAISTCEFHIQLITQRRSSELREEDAVRGQQALFAYEILKHIEFPECEAPFNK